MVIDLRSPSARLPASFAFCLGRAEALDARARTAISRRLRARACPFCLGLDELTWPRTAIDRRRLDTRHAWLFAFGLGEQKPWARARTAIGRRLRARACLSALALTS